MVPTPHAQKIESGDKSPHSKLKAISPMADTPPKPSAKKPAEAENIKAASNFLRGTILQSLANRVTASVPESDGSLLKFHGTYMQDDRDLRDERARQRLEPAFDFMIRIRAAGGIVTPQQWLQLDALVAQIRQRRNPPHHAAVVPVPRRAEVEPPPDDPRHQPDVARHAGRLRRREPQRDVQPESVPVGSPRRGLRVGEAAQPAPGPADPGLS